MSQPEEDHEQSGRVDPIQTPPTANPDRVRLSPEGIERTPDEGGQEEPGAVPE